MSAQLDPKMKIAGPYFFKICGQVYHYVYNSLKPKNDCKPKYNQLYIIDSEEANSIRLNHDANKNVCQLEVNNFKFYFKYIDFKYKFFYFILFFYEILKVILIIDDSFIEGYINIS